MRNNKSNFPSYDSNVERMRAIEAYIDFKVQRLAWDRSRARQFAEEGRPLTAALFGDAVADAQVSYLLAVIDGGEGDRLAKYHALLDALAALGPPALGPPESVQPSSVQDDEPAELGERGPTDDELQDIERRAAA